MATQIATKIKAANPRREGSSITLPAKNGSTSNRIYTTRAYTGQPDPSVLANHVLRNAFDYTKYGQ